MRKATLRRINDLILRWNKNGLSLQDGDELLNLLVLYYSKTRIWTYLFIFNGVAIGVALGVVIFRGIWSIL